MAYKISRRVYMETTKNKQIVALVLGIASLVIPNIGTSISNAIDTSTNDGSLTAGIIVIVATLAAIVVGQQVPEKKLRQLVRSRSLLRSVLSLQS